MYYFITSLVVIIFSRAISGSWRKTILLPWVILTTPMLIGAGLANLLLVPFLISPWSLNTHAVVILGTVALGISSFTLKKVHGPLWTSSKNISWNETTLVRILLLITFVAVAANALQFIIAGKIPLFSADPDHARIEAAKNGYLHVFSALPGHIIPIVTLILATGENLKTRTRRILIAIMVASFIMLSLWIARGMLLYPILTSIAIMYLLDQRSFGVKKLVLVVSVLVFIVAGIKYIRDSARFGGTFTTTQKQLVSSDMRNMMLLGPAVSLYLSTALNYEILNRYVQAVPSLAPHTYGRLTASHLLAFIPGTGRPYSELDYQNTILKKSEYDFTLTSTFLGAPYLEFGMTGVVIFSCIIGWLYKTVWLGMQRNGSPWTVFLYGYLISMAAFIPYAFIYCEVSFIWFILTTFPIIYLCQCRVCNTSVFYNKSRIVFRL